MRDGGASALMLARRIRSRPTMCCWPMNSSNERGLIREASGAESGGEAPRAGSLSGAKSGPASSACAMDYVYPDRLAAEVDAKRQDYWNKVFMYRSASRAMVSGSGLRSMTSTDRYPE